MSDTIQTRKRQHLDLCLEESVSQRTTGLEQVRLAYDALFSIPQEALDTRSKCAGIDVAFPLMFGAMTGGIPEATPLNTTLRSLAKTYHLPMSVGSIRVLLRDPTCLETFGQGHVEALIANIGVSEIAPENAEKIENICTKLGASILCIHLNGLQEWVQDEGNHSFSCDLDKIAAFIARFKLPILFKEVGQGLGGQCAKRLSQLPIAGLETASLGATSWVKIENLRRNKPLFSENLQSLMGLGYDMKTAIRDCRLALGPHRTVIASGGISRPDELVKALALGADLVAIAQPLYALWQTQGARGLEAWVEEFIDVSKLIWRSTACPSKLALANNGLARP